jgi:hypothetical protein
LAQKLIYVDFTTTQNEFTRSLVSD